MCKYLDKLQILFKLKVNFCIVMTNLFIANPKSFGFSYKGKTLS